MPFFVGRLTNNTCSLSLCDHWGCTTSHWKRVCIVHCMPLYGRQIVLSQRSAYVLWMREDIVGRRVQECIAHRETLPRPRFEDVLLPESDERVQKAILYGSSQQYKNKKDCSEPPSDSTRGIYLSRACSKGGGFCNGSRTAHLPTRPRTARNGRASHTSAQGIQINSRAQSI